MKYAFSFLVVTALALIAGLGSMIPGTQYLFGVAIPYLAVAIFLFGFVYKVVNWAKSPVPFSIQTTCGQGKSLDFIKHNKLEAPQTKLQVMARMFLEVVFFRSLFRNTKAELHDGPKLTHESSKWLWLFALIFHYCFLLIVVRHLRLFLDPVPAAIAWVEYFDGIMQIGAPRWYMTSVGLPFACILLFGRRLWNRQVRYISLMNDYFPLVLIFGIAVTGILMRYFLHVDIITTKEMLIGLATFSPVVGGTLPGIFCIHILLVSVLLACFPYSKLMHSGGVFMSPTRNMTNASRAVRHINPWNPEIKPHSYAGYEDEFREFMVEAGLPVDKELPASKEA
ncbi:sulfate reduction electron transfer complex DsrMKJOP subunit DsrM [Desulfotalea psychrophila]|uniref:Hypothetical membrane protein n=1 Tax=Desulfotalea psychrophila (strain LSv54 / DSM 12343) TaxID=177439 RepID=Q6AIM6_DESPS|nr:sulfate reduction electron transfer complex DsrMKJOP subunit DsrM [Desulfotalea psychrophila]CAG37804.1 hypothetical membrane protein [Desulfotalea psychrophila LSv54]